MIKLIIFDFDDTLADSKNVRYEMDTLAAKRLGLKPVSERKYFKYYGTPYRELIKQLYPDVSVNKFIDVASDFYDLNKFHLFLKTEEILLYLKDRKYKLAILSSEEGPELKTLLKHLKIQHYFDYVHAKEDSKHYKPDPRVFDDILNKFKLKKSEVAYVGDLPIDRDAALAAGIFFIGINHCPKQGIIWTDSIEGLKKIF